MNDYYSLLEIRRGANPSEISVAYRRILKEKFQKAGYNEQVSDITKAYRILSNPDKRKEYDLLLQKVAGKYVLQNPKNPTPADKKYLAGMNAMERKNFQVAVDYFKQSIKLDPEKGHFYSHLGLALGMFTGKLAEAERYCKKAIELETDNPELCYNLGFLYQRHNLVEAAQQAFLQAQEAEQKRWEIFFKENNSPIEALWYGEKTEEMVPEIKAKEESGIKEILPLPVEQPMDIFPDKKEAVIQKKESIQKINTKEKIELSGEKPGGQKKEDESGMFSEQIVLAEIIHGDSDKTQEDSALKKEESFPEAVEKELIDDADKIIDAVKESSGKNEMNRMELLAPGSKKQMGAEPASSFMEGVAKQEDVLLLIKEHSEADELEDLIPGNAELSVAGSSSGISTGDQKLLMEIGPQPKTVPTESFSSADSETKDEKPPSLDGIKLHSESQTLEELENEALNLLKELGLSPSDQVDLSDNPEAGFPAAEPKDEERGGEDKHKEDIPIQGQDENSVAELKRLEEMEKKMAEDLMRLKEEREKLKKKIGV